MCIRDSLYCVEKGEGDMVLCAGTGMNAAVRDGEESYFVFGDYIEESMQGKALWRAKLSAGCLMPRSDLDRIRS